MNTTGFVRGYMAKQYETERFLQHVAGVIEKQLQELDEHYQVKVSKMDDVVISVRNRAEIIIVTMSDAQSASLQSRSPYALDRFIWTRLLDSGIDVNAFDGNYLTYVFK